MLDAWINAVDVWYANPSGTEVEIVDENGDFTGEYGFGYDAPIKVRANLSPAHGSAEDNVFGLSVNYSKILTTARMNLGINEHSIVWDKKPDIQEAFFATLDSDGHIASVKVDNPGDADSIYKVVRVAVGRYHVRYALKKLHGDD